MLYSEDYRKRAVEYYHEGNRQAEVKEVFKIHPSTLRDWEARYEAGSLKPNYPKTRKARKLPLDKLERYVSDNPDAFLSEIGEYFDCSAEAVRKALIKLNVTLKKRPSATKSAAKLNEPNMSRR
jgi:transposase